MYFCYKILYTTNDNIISILCLNQGCIFRGSIIIIVHYPAIGSCVDANHTMCCTYGNCQGFPPVCLCSAECHSLGTCCHDIDTVCPISAPTEGMTKFNYFGNFIKNCTQ